MAEVEDDAASSSVYAVNFSFGKICRLCLGMENLISLEEKTTKSGRNRKGPILAKRIAAVTGIRIFENDPFPQWVCRDCVKKLNSAAVFIQKSKNSQTQLEERFASTLANVGCSQEQIKEIVSLRGAELTQDVVEGDEIFTKEELIKFEKESSGSRKRGAAVYLEEEDFPISIDDIKTETIAVDHDYLFSQNLSICPICKATLKNEVFNLHLQCHKAVPRSATSRSCRYCSKKLSGETWHQHLEGFHRVTTLEPLPESYDCKICLRPLRADWSLRHHYEHIHGEHLDQISQEENCSIVWRCKECDTSFSDENVFVMHCARLHGKIVTDAKNMRRLQPNTVTCEECGYIKTSPVEDKIHEIFLHNDEGDEEMGENDVLCPACELILPDRDALQEHLVRSHFFLFVRLETNCIFCDASFDDYFSAKNHLQKDHDVRFDSPQQQITNCKKEVGVGVLELELQTGEIVEITDAICCTICDAIFDSHEALSEHQCPLEERLEGGGSLPKTSKITGSKHEETACPVCFKVYSSKYRLSRHYEKSHIKEKGIKKFTCPNCPKKFTSKQALQVHEDKVHIGKCRFTCSQCPQGFGTDAALRKHSEIHMAVRPMKKCDICGREFASHSGFTRHVILHGGTKDYNCTFCEKAFYTARELTQHTKYHTQDLNYCCSFCGRKFLMPKQLRNHISSLHMHDQTAKRRRRR